MFRLNRGWTMTLTMIDDDDEDEKGGPGKLGS
jgi:hypothetical protein